MGELQLNEGRKDLPAEVEKSPAVELHPRVSAHMTPCPYTAHLRDTAQLARDVMRAHHIRHLPVVDAGKPRGMVLDHQLHSGVPPETPLASIMAPAYSVDESALLSAVVAEMTAQRCDSAVITRQGSVVGVFTVIDALRLLRALIERGG